MQNSNIKRLIGMLKCMNNPPFFKYRVFHYLKKDVPHISAKKIAKRNIDDYEGSGLVEIIVETYDGSCQAVHPDITLWNSLFWLVVTPYPYGMEEYENPCVYVIEKLSGIIRCQSEPLAKPRKHDYGFHLSDPCIFHDSDSIKCLYRETWKYNSSIYNGLYVSIHDGKWKKPRLVLSSSDDPLLSPAVIVDKIGNYHIYTALNQNYLVHRVFDKAFQPYETESIDCLGLPKDYSVWHIAIVYSSDLEKNWSKSNDLVGIFLLRNKNNYFKLYMATTDSLNSSWYIGEEINLPDFLINDVKTVYKSCFIPGSNKILVSFRDKKDRYRLCVI